RTARAPTRSRVSPPRSEGSPPYNPAPHAAHRPPSSERHPMMFKRQFRRTAVASLVAGVAAATTPASAADKVKVGFVSTLSGPSSALGIDIRDGFLLAVKLNGGKLGGLPAEVLVSD